MVYLNWSKQVKPNVNCFDGREVNMSKLSRLCPKVIKQLEFES